MSPPTEGSSGGAAPGSDLARTMTVRNVALALLGAAVLVLNARYHGPFEDLVHAYAGNVAVSFALYFAVVNATSRYRASRPIAAAVTLLAVGLFEVTDGFGVLENVVDPMDLVADAAGVGLAVVVDVATGRMLRRGRAPSGPGGAGAP